MTSSDTSATSVKGRPTGVFRPDIEGMRAIAIGLVLIYHAGVRQLPGGFVGVDVFFVISGFLITGLLIRELERTGRISLATFYARRAKRLLPATGLVLATTALLTWWTVSAVDWRAFGGDIVSAALYVVNWRLADRSVDYLAEDVGASPVQHFWSLAVEEQFYIVWPLLIVALAWWLRRRGHMRIRPVLTAGILAVIVPSLAYSVYLTTSSPATAFFVTPTRLWELGIGALVAIGTTAWLRLRRSAAIVLGWAGLAAVIASGFWFSTSTPWPGSAALVPTLGTAAMIIAGYTSGRAGVAGVLSWRPAVWVGGLSYSLYLWHWPLIVAATAYWGDLGARRGLLVVAASFIPAYISYRLVENPVRFAPSLKSNRLSLSVGANFTAVGVLAGLLLVLVVPSSTGGGSDREAPGASAIGSGAEPEAGTTASLADVEWYVPDPVTAVEDVPPYPPECQVDQQSPVPVRCEWGDVDGDLTIGVVGDSKIMQWYSAIDEIAKDEGWRIVSYTKSACGFHDGMQVAKGEPYESCAAWNDAVFDELVELGPDLVLTSQRINDVMSDPDDVESRSVDAMVDAMVRRWTALTETGTPMIVLLDNPNPGMAVYECVAENPDDLTQCQFDLEEGISRSGALAQVPAAKKVPDAKTIDLRSEICPGDPCVPVIGNVLLYRQTSHLTDTYARTLTEQLRNELVPAVEEVS
ncbi:peptidoglycan/LPS O-acetylase OafA/YrhL [Isoptericola sp. CG 20/1183]|uniref:Peptidoglycan/LPS O-acetylase OafA/YrhL n=1 Tax=Isoptericola halotolerans TaxID=300560 RepID=A0ABX5EC51_9MICO|nr:MULTISPECIES: acyltransferase family protein [Isoptericola]MCK0118290.1 acyltransferase [Isoptericola sp. S6320L]PRZ04934.1 peptidoglycan/LPS O-acetylase OafA/YrhL [Isoptericola halotolerans]PRZ05425.1 peptidoglycan/LPS O-acetylase OafA/YrhL [Isoptericola sp. CG 20/1183]